MIGGYGELVMEELPTEDPLRPSVQIIIDAGIRAGKNSRVCRTQQAAALLCQRQH